MYVTIFPIVKSVDLELLKSQLIGIRAKDKTFKFKIDEKKGILMLIIFSNDINTAYKRGMWVMHNIFNGELMFTVKEIGKNRR